MQDDSNIQPAMTGPGEVMDRLTALDRILTEARMLPKRGKLTDEQISGVVAQFNQFCALNEVTLARAAAGIDYSPSTLTEWRNGTYKGDRTPITYAVNNWLELEARRIQAVRPDDYIRTTVAERMKTMAYLAHKNRAMAAIVAPSGSGKTKVLQVLKEEMTGVLVTCHERMSSLILLRAIAAELGFKRESATRARLHTEIIDRLRDTNRPILIDEAHRMGRDIGCLRDIHDLAGVPIIMAGTDEILSFIDDRAHGRGQYSRRVIRFNAMDEVRDVGGHDGGSSGRDLFSVEEIRQFFAAKKIRIANDDALMMLWAISCLPGHGSLGMALLVAGISVDLSDDGAVTVDAIQDSLRTFFGGPGSREVSTLAARQLKHVPGLRRMAAVG